MIIRIFRVTAEPGRRDDFESFLREEALPMMKRQPGLVSITAGLPEEATPDEFCLVMVWESVEALSAFAGEDWRRPHIHPDEKGVVKDRALHHYRLLEA